MDFTQDEPAGMAGVSRRTAMRGLAFGAAALGAASSVHADARSDRPSAGYAFRQVDVFSPQPLRGNPLAVVIGADGLSDAQMIQFSKWTNLSETTFLLKPTDPAADYRVRIFSLGEELPFAGHPTLGSCHAWLAAGGKPRGKEIIQQCGVGLVHLRGHLGRLAFEAPPLRHAAPVAPDVLARLCRGLGLSIGDVTASAVLSGGLDQTALMIKSRAQLLSIKADWPMLATDGVGLIAPWGPKTKPEDPDFEVRLFDHTLANGEDPVTGSFNANVARWLIGTGMAPDHYLVSQGTVLERAGRVYVDRDAGRIWIGGDVADHVVGSVTL